MSRYSGVVIDFYDDKGETIKGKFPTVEDLPEIIKTANVQPQDKLANENFALVALDGGEVLRKFACNDKGTTAMSVIYFMEHADKLPETAVKTAATNIASACTRFGIIPPEALTKLALNVSMPAGIMRKLLSVESKSPGIMAGLRKGIPAAVQGAVPGAVVGYTLAEPGQGISGAAKGALIGGALHGGARGIAAGMKTTAPKMAPEKFYNKLLKTHGVAPKAFEGEQWATLKTGPVIPNWLRSTGETTKTSSAIDVTGQPAMTKVNSSTPKNDSDYMYVSPKGERMYPIDSWDRVKMAENYLLENEKQLPVHIKRQCAVKLANKANSIGYMLSEKIKESGTVKKASIGHLRSALEMRKLAGADKNLMDELFEKQAQLKPEVYAECLRRADIEAGLDRFWNNRIPDPWASTYSMTKTAEVVWENGADRVTDEELEALARNRSALLNKTFSVDFVNQFVEDPVGIFESLPMPQKKLLARLASDVNRDGESEMTEPNYDAILWEETKQK